MTRPTTQTISPFFIVSNVNQTIAFYRDKLGFETRFQQPERNPFFAIIGRDGAQIFIKSDKDTKPLPNWSPFMILMSHASYSAPERPSANSSSSMMVTLTPFGVASE